MLKTIPLLDTLYELQLLEWMEGSGSDIVPQRGQSIKLPDGREDIKHRLWDEIRQDQYGNQRFNNDSFYRVPFEDGDEDISDDMKILKHYCKEALNREDEYSSFLLFDVCW